MKIIFQSDDGRERSFFIPEWASMAVIDIMAGVEHLASYTPCDDVLRVKVSRCVKCGKCCEKIKCDRLLDDGNGIKICNDWPMRPYICCIAESKLADCKSIMKAVE
jgi:hypothetical protein